MQAIILCPGPSLARLHQVPPADLTIAVNRAGLKFPAAWLAALDLPSLLCYGDQVLGQPLLLTNQATFESLSRRQNRLAGRVGQVAEELAAQCPRNLGWERYSATAALVLADKLGAKMIEVYGADWTNEPDFDGHVSKDFKRDAGRWEREGAIWGATCDWLKCRGVVVSRKQI